MHPAQTSPAAPLTRDQWQELLTGSLPGSELEPPVRRRCRRYGVNLGTWRLVYLRETRPAELRVTLLNAALDGLMTRSREELPERVSVVLVLTTADDVEHRLLGEVVHCTGTVGGYKVGIRLRFAEPARIPGAGPVPRRRLGPR